MEENKFAGMELEELEAARDSLKARIKVNANLTQFLESEAGKRLIADKQADLAAVCQRYGKLSAKGSAEEIVRELVKLQAWEVLLRKEVEKYLFIEKEKIVLDTDMRLCYSNLNARKSADRVGR